MEDLLAAVRDGPPTDVAGAAGLFRAYEADRARSIATYRDAGFASLVTGTRAARPAEPWAAAGAARPAAAPDGAGADPERE